MLLFLKKKVLQRPIKPTRGGQFGEDGRRIVRTLSYRSIESYVSALASLWSRQAALKTNHYPPPRGTLVKAVLKNRQYTEAARRRTEYVDRGALTIQDGYSPETFSRVVRACWQSAPAGIVKASVSTSTFAGLRTAVDLLFAHNMLLRSESQRHIQLPDLFALPLAHEGPSPCVAAVLITDQGKKNQFGKIQYSAVVRHRDVRVCTIAHLAAYLVYRWDITGEAPPRFQRRRLWYDTFLLLGHNPAKAMSYDTQLKWTAEAFQKAGLSSIKKTHAGRAQGAKQAELEGVPEAQIRRAGQWNTDALSNCYLSHLPRDFVRSMAGFDPARQGNYYVPRTKVTPPLALLSAVWPWLDQWRAWFAVSEPGSIPLSYDSLPLDQDGEDRTDLAAQGLLALLAELRVAFLQDSVLLRREYPEHPLWRHEVFVREDYQTFALEVELAVRDGDEPFEIRLRNVMPDVSAAISHTRKQLLASVEEWGSRTTQDGKEILRRMDDFCSTRTLTATTTVRIDSASSAGPSAASPAALPRRTTPPPEPAAQVGEPDPAAPFTMDRTIQAVPSVWREWTEGLGGRPSVEAMDQQYGARWRVLQRDRTFYCRRKPIVDEIRARVVQGVARSEAEAVAQLEVWRQERGWSLNKLAISLGQQGSNRR